MDSSEAHHAHEGASKRVRHFSPRPRGYKIILYHNESEANIDILWFDEETLVPLASIFLFYDNGRGC